MRDSLPAIVSAELKRSIFPAFTSMVQHELQGAREAVPNAVYIAMKDLPREVEKALTPVIQRAVSSTVASSVSFHICQREPN